MRWGLIGASTIAEQHMIGAIRAMGGEVAAVVSSTAARARDYAAQHAIPAAGDSLPLILDDPSIGVVYISSTNEKHRDQALGAIAAGKHVICEKPLAMTVAEAADGGAGAGRARGRRPPVHARHRVAPVSPDARRRAAHAGTERQLKPSAARDRRFARRGAMALSWAPCASW